MSLLDELFGQILHSEEIIKVRFEQLKDAHSQILDHQSKIKDAEFNLHSHQGTLAVKNQKLIQVETELKWLITREQMLKSQLGELEAKKNEIIERNMKADNQLICERNKFIEETKRFAKKYELPANFEMDYERELDKEIMVLKQETSGFLSELEAVKRQQENINKLQVQVEQLNKSIMELLLERDERQESLKKLTDKTAALLTNKAEIENEPNSSLEFRRLSDELSACQKESIELNKKKQEFLNKLYRNQQELMKVESQRKASSTNNETNKVNSRGSLFKSAYSNDNRRHKKDSID